MPDMYDLLVDRAATAIRKGAPFVPTCVKIAKEWGLQVKPFMSAVSAELRYRRRVDALRKGQLQLPGFTPEDLK